MAQMFRHMSILVRKCLMFDCYLKHWIEESGIQVVNRILTSYWFIDLLSAGSTCLSMNLQVDCGIFIPKC